MINDIAMRIADNAATLLMDKLFQLQIIVYYSRLTLFLLNILEQHK